MKNRKIAEVLKAYRKMNNLSVRDVTELLEEKSLKVAEKTVYGWESSATQPDADTLLLLCDIYNIDNILGTFGYTDEEPINLTKHEHHLIEQYRKHPEIQDAVDKLMCSQLKRVLFIAIYLPFQINYKSICFVILKQCTLIIYIIITESVSFS